MRKILNLRTLLLLVVFVVLVAAIATAGYFYYQYQKIRKDPGILTEQELSAITNDLSKMIDLPVDESPSLVTVVDKEKLSQEIFFKNAENGDKVLLYSKAAKAILYRPATGRVIEFASLISSPKAASGSAAPTGTVTPIKIVLLNGSTVPGVTAEYEKKFTGVNGLTVVAKRNAAKSDYNQNLVVDLTGKNQEAVTAIAQAIGGVVSTSAPAGEEVSNGDVLVIIGNGQ